MSKLPNKTILSWRKAIFLNTLFWVVIWGIALWNNFQWAAVANREFSLDILFSWSFPNYLSMVLIGPIIYRLLVGWMDHSYTRQVIFHLGPSVIVGFIHQLILNAFASLFNAVPVQSQQATFLDKLQIRYDTGLIFSSNGLLFYWLVVGFFYSIILYQKYRQEELNNIHLKSDLTMARLQSLQMQLQPHFLFNSFNTISMMARQNKGPEVVEMIGLLGELLRESLELKDTQMLSLKDEMELTKKYLQIQQIRLRDRLALHIDIPQDAMNVRVPSLLFQPIVENAFQHGIEKTSGPVSFSIIGKTSGESITISFSNNGNLLEEDFEINSHAGFGLATTLSRLDHTYAKAYTFELKNTPEQTGVIAKLTLPRTS
ncbi:sensor histidine kinase [Ekhidna sp. To15]|uniref:sensor histidine kinase n=1 Tax=Ekhidna sp. To15 TaxID=3395267 RepID=UPI003F522E0D